MASSPRVERQRVTWPRGDPARLREAWGNDARAFARLENRPAVVGLIAALLPYLHAEYGHAWVSDETLRAAMGAKHRSAVSRAMKIADEGLGLIERETVSILGAKGLFLGNERRIYPTRPAGMDAALMAVRASKPVPKFGDRRRAAEPMAPRVFHRRPSDISPMSEPTSERLGQDTGTDYLSRKVKETSAHSDFGAAARRYLGRSELLVTTTECASWLDFSLPTEGTVEKILELGRQLYRAARRGLISQADLKEAVDELRDAAKRSWVEDVDRLAAMFAVFDVRENETLDAGSAHYEQCK